MPTEVTSRRRRRETLLSEAAALFADRGYAAVGVDDIGAAAGITGPGVYRHFPSKQAILAALFDDATGRLLAGAQQIVAGSEALPGQLRALVRTHAGLALSERGLISVYLAEEHALPAADRRRQRATQRRYVDHWLRLAGPLRPDLSARDLLLVVQAVLGMLNSVAFHSGHADHDRAVDLLTGSALAALLGPAHDRDPGAA